MNREYQICSKCVMDTTDADIVFDDKGVCNHCHSYEKNKKKLFPEGLDKEAVLYEMLEKVRVSGRTKRYDCIIGVSGGVDSSYIACLAKDWGLNPLLVHFDNGWDSELSVKNVERIVAFTGWDLYTIVVDWNEFSDIQKAFFEADVIDLELISDHAIFATVYKLARKYKVKYLLSGENFATEAIMPKSWNWRKGDAKNIKSIHKMYGKKAKDISFYEYIKATEV